MPAGAIRAKPAFTPVLKEDAVWHFFPRDEQAAKRVADGRWQHPPAPVNWKVREPMAAPLAVRRNLELGLTAVVMAPAEDCLGIYSPYGEEGHGSIYLGLLGGDLKAGQSASGRCGW